MWLPLKRPWMLERRPPARLGEVVSVQVIPNPHEDLSVFTTKPAKAAKK